MNKVILLGRLTRDPEVRYTQSGKAVASFSIAVNRFAGGQEQADFIPIVAWEKLAETCGNNLTKGRRVLVEGRLSVRSYEANDGQKRRVTEVVAQNVEYLDSRQTSGTEAGNIDINSFGKDVFPEEEIPF
ncbi:MULTISPECIES: single-stranded DNA-binding protein [Sporomusa]|jgi:single-strand DNA-binding protein|uniref:Single-stranded DNA-binding protein n=2 Tax=Sporomusa TaxID=2375 RepID=A0ABP2C445_9FIRM|nr:MULTISPECIES: single-stranded DNA-binding protein [Sporomusa]MCM0759359.1 single-stranded DNA-binding protein [Sporomusa sphaeroides DSM 2875]OLS56447.1 single-stranded DNA-binding protein A [Sporomusa sphaeroides DSM 2875]CVK18542.1 Single-stranded DNA-binding protein ssb [Sporomusa sphaeroides DSM 2875]SCM82299.1 Single-stranded DNA-binding protein [uncultured Sporomusa sp.]HML35514.1 single-stranded DNA-binding protein [Sporomusa sphaeroides]